jgi:hypothetical protein
MSKSIEKNSEILWKEQMHGWEASEIDNETIEHNEKLAQGRLEKW